MADDDIDVEGEFNFKLEASGGLYDANELPSKSANLLPEFTNPPWMLEQGWPLDNGMDEKSKATIEKMLMEEQQYINGHKKGKYLGINKSVLLITSPSQEQKVSESGNTKRLWSPEEKQLFLQGLEKFGHSWSKISQLIQSRTTVQVKNYAKQFFKTQAKGKGRNVEDPQLPTSLTPPPASTCASSSSLSSSVTAASTSAGLLMESQALVSTARPTVLARSHPSLRGRPKSVRRKVPGASHRKAAVVEKVGAHSMLDTNHVNVAVSGVSSSENDVKTEKLGTDALNSILHTSALKRSERTSDSESEVDIDIENDDEGDNPILQNRSASPSSVYNRLLEQAKAGASTSPPEVSHPPQELEGPEKGAGSSDWPEDPDGEVDDDALEEGPVGCPDVGDVGNSMQGEEEEEEESSAVEEEGRQPQDEEQCVDSHDVKIIVNGVTASTGEIFEFPIPIEDRELEVESITDEEKNVHSEFFDGRPLKTPERYLKIRNYILDCWKKSRPGYLNKTSVRPGLKNCGDVNCIGRIHAYLECIGAINFGCEQASYNNPGRVMAALPRQRPHGKEQHRVVSMAKLDSVQPRRRRIRDASGLWVDEKELEGKTIEHKPAEEDPSRPKRGRHRKIVYDPFRLVPCQTFSQDKQAPFSVSVSSTALAVMDIHSHISRTEVIGMLGGQFHPTSACLTVSMAVPCKSISTGMQCEMDPVSQTQASEQIEDVGMVVVGWYHSHPTFAPSPSVRDIETQQKFQHWFSRGGSHFVGIIISPYSPHNASVVSDVRCLTISQELAREYLCNLPYQFDYSVVQLDNMREILGPASELAERYAQYSSRVGLSSVYRSSLRITCLSKMLQSVKHRLELSEGGSSTQTSDESRRKVDDVLHWLEQIFVDKFSSSSSDSTPGTDSGITSVVPPGDEDMQV
ncbi:hypothetical protein ACOMHN_011647 [Nucella lapillus]